MSTQYFEGNNPHNQSVHLEKVKMELAIEQEIGTPPRVKINGPQTNRIVLGLQGNAREFDPEFIKEIRAEIRKQNPEGLHEVLAITGRGTDAQLIHLFP